MKIMLSKALVFVVIGLFIGAGVFPSIGGNDCKINVVEDKGDLEGKIYEKEY